MSLAVRIGSLASLYALREPSQSKSIRDVGEGAVTAAGRPDGAPGPWRHWSTASIRVPLGVEAKGWRR